MPARSPSVASSCPSATSPAMMRNGSKVKAAATTTTTAGSPPRIAPTAHSMLQMLEYMRTFTAQRQSEHVSPSPPSASSSKQGSPGEINGSGAAVWTSPPPPPALLNDKGRQCSETGSDNSEEIVLPKKAKLTTPRVRTAKRPRSDSARAAIDPVPTVAVTPASAVEASAASAAQNGFGRHLRRFTIDSHARPEELLAALLQHTRSFAMAPPSTSSLTLSPFSHHPIAPSSSSLSTVGDDDSFWFAPPPPSSASSMMEFDGHRMMQHRSSHSSLPAPWSMDMDAVQAPSHTSSVASSTTDSSQAADTASIPSEGQDKIITLSDFLQHPNGYAWLKEMRDINGNGLPTFSDDDSSAALKSPSVPCGTINTDAIPALPRSMLQQAPQPPVQKVHNANGTTENHFQTSAAMTNGSLNEQNNQATAATSMSMLDNFIANIAASIDHQSTAAANALQSYAKHDIEAHIFPEPVNDFDNRPRSAVSNASGVPSASCDVDANVKLNIRPTPRSKAKKALPKLTLEADESCDPSSTVRAAPAKQRQADMSPAYKKARRTRMVKVEKAVDAITATLQAEGARESPPPAPTKKPERDQKRLADRRRRRRESHNAVERRRRDLINERIAELATLLPEPMLLEAIAHSTGGGTAPHIDLAPFTRKGIAEARARARVEAAAAAAVAAGSDADSEADDAYDDMLADDDEDGREAALLDAIAKSKPNKGIILTKSVDYIKQLHEVCAAMRAKNVELQQQLESVRRAVLGGGGAAANPERLQRDEQIDTDDSQSSGSLRSPKNAFRRAPDRVGLTSSFESGSLRAGPAFGSTLMMNFASNSISPSAT